MSEVISIQGNDLKQMLSIEKKAAAVLERGGLVVFPTETVYGVAALVNHDDAYRAMCAMKGIASDAVFAMHVPDREAVGRYIDLESPSSPAIRRFVNKAMPGPVTLLVEVDDPALRRLAAAGIHESAIPRVVDKQTIGLRCPQHPLAEAVLSSLEPPIIAGTPGLNGETQLPVTASMAMDLIRKASPGSAERVGLIVDAGPTRFGKPSTIVRLKRQMLSGVDGPIAHYEPVVEREGVWDKRSIARLSRWTMLLVCSGNTCRSPMAEGLAKQMLARQRGIEVDKLDRVGIRVVSAAAYGVSGMPAAPEAVEMMAAQGVDLSAHRSRAMTPELIHEADVILCMTRSHRAAVIGMSSGAADRTMLLDAAGEVEDPIGQGPAAYRRAAHNIERALAQRLREQQP